jgi:hypothetical protein
MDLIFLRAPSYPMMIMNEKTKPEQQAGAPEGEPSEQVPDWLASKLRRMNNQVVEESLPDELVALLKQLENNERNR